jgi:recombination protein RecA
MNDVSRIDRLVAAAPSLKTIDLTHSFHAKGQLQGPSATEIPVGWRLATLAGRFTEISGSSAGTALTFVFRLVYEAQIQAEPVAWISKRTSIFFPPDAADSGIDILAVAIIRCPDNISTARSAEHLLRSGAFGLVVIDFGADAHLPQHAQSRLSSQARHHHTAFVCITEKEGHQPSLGPLVSLRAHTERLSPKRHLYRSRVKILKDKRHGPGWDHEEVCHGPDGLY